MNIYLDAERATVEASGTKTIRIDIDGTDEEQLLSYLKIEDCISYFGAKTFLDEIGEDACKEHFGLIEDNS